VCHAGRPHEAEQYLDAVERIAAHRGDDLLRGLAGLARGWRHLAEDQTAAALQALLPVRTISGDFHQHHLVDMYIGLSLFRLDDYSAAALQWYEAMRNALGVGHLRGVAGSMEGCAYIAERWARADAACRFLSAAGKIRARAGSPLFSFWISHNEFAHASLRSSMGLPAYEDALNAGARMREEDAINEAMALLIEFGAADADAQAAAKIPLGS
jgi:hypothetical protein